MPGYCCFITLLRLISSLCIPDLSLFHMNMFVLNRLNFFIIDCTQCNLINFFSGYTMFFPCTKPLEQWGGGGWGGCRGALAPLTPIFLSKVKLPFFNNHVNTFYLACHVVKSCFWCILFKIMIKFASSVMGKPFLAIL